MYFLDVVWAETLWWGVLCSVLFWEVCLLSYVLSINFRTYLGIVTIEQITPQQVREAEKSLRIMESMIQSMTPSTSEVPLSIHVVHLFRCCLWGVSYFLKRFQFVCNSYNNKIKGLLKIRWCDWGTDLIIAMWPTLCRGKGWSRATCEVTFKKTESCEWFW